MAGTAQHGSGTTVDERHRLPVKTLVSASIGNAVEWFDWTVYATFVVYFAGQFFPSENEALALIGATSTYALAFFFRPLGGILLGRFADLRGRKAGMLLTILLMAGGSMVIAILPTYEQVGWLAPVLLLLARIAQGMSLGGEVSNASAYLGEIAPPAHRGRYSSFFYISTGSALLLASLLGVLLTRVLDEQQLQDYGWRIAFFIGGLLGLIGMWLRRSLVETEQFEESAEKARATKHPLLQTIKHHPKAVIQLCSFTLLSTLSYYTFFSALTPFAISFRDADDNDVFLALSIGTALFVALCYPFGALSDRFGRKPQMLVWSGGYAVLIVPLSFLVQDNLFSLIVVFCVGLGLYALLASIAPAIMSELFPTELRATGIGAWYNLTVALFGGTAPLVITALSEAGHPLWFFWYVAIAAAFAFAVILTLTETKGTELK
ncbi:MFS transporter [Geodermatophilus sabuli]|uniref:Putative proline/betaine transporter n=1 Tax=Geodermatophilus sabuli TaxID=1564158 RepID=A0A285ECS9_9ACTN|nr:MFS transporter [Geodermatophilus sabuli]MBB3083360.1 MHS family alpha-ketoglutarate permease-like MFS transporter [Geodermatophilus sabuli]SNX96919.1 MFS transporter, MHS family, alpha-ketoglutarate permease [Geodermatophilus sabuli]